MRRRALLLLACAALAALLAAPFGSAGTTTGSVSAPHALVTVELKTLDQINALRASYGLGPLTVDQALMSAATAHSRQMLADGYFSHGAANGVAFSQRVGYYYPAAGAATYGVGENLLYVGGPLDASGIVARWMRSPGHRENLLSPAWRQLGISVLTVRSAPGVFDGGRATVVTVDFGVRS
jgi:uncharacterized protein YkwD